MEALSEVVVSKPAETAIRSNGSTSHPATTKISVKIRDVEPDSTAQTHQQAIERALLLMRGRFKDGLTLDDMAAHACMSPYHFNRIFREVVGLPPGQFLSALRIEAAKRLLLETEASTLEVCYEVGYNSLGSFTSRFTQLVGLAPGQFRQLGQRFTARLEDVLTLVGPVREPALRGFVETPPEVDGLIFLGLFADPIPQGRPRSCAILGSAGPFRVHLPDDGQYHLFAAGMARFEDALDFLRPSVAIRAVASVGPFGRNAMRTTSTGPLRLTLRPPTLFDPPLLATLPVLLDERFAERFGLEQESA